MIKVLIFDFDGTIADSVNIKTKAFAKLYKPYGKDIADKVIEYHLLNGGVSRFDKFRYFHKQFLNKELSGKEIKDLAKKFSKLVIDKVVNSPYIPGSFEFISKNYTKFDMYISTATPKYEIDEIIKKKNLQKYFIKVLGSPTSKIEHVRKTISENNYSPKEMVFIGDSDSDENAANTNGIHFFKVTNEKHPNNNKHIINNFFDFENIIKRI